MTTPRAPLEPHVIRTAIVVLFGTVMTVLDATIVNVALNDIGRDFGSSISTIQWVLTGYTLALSMTVPLTGWAVTRFGGRAVWLGSLLAFGIGSVLCGLAWSVPALVAFRVVQGIGGGALLPAGQTMLAQAAGPERLGRVMPIVVVPAMLAPMLGPVLGGVILDSLDWRWLFGINIPVCLVAVVLAVRLLPRDEARTRTDLDWFGLLLISPGLAALVYGLSEAGNGAGLTSARVLAGVVAGLALTAAGTAWSWRRGAAALIDVRLFARRSFAAPVAAMFCYSVGMFGALVLMPLYFQLVRGGSALEAGTRIAPLGAGAIVTMLVSARVTERLGPRVTAAAGTVVVIVGLLGYTRLTTSTDLWLLAGALFVVGLGHGLTTPPLLTAAYRGLSRAAAPAASTASNVVLRVGTAIGPAVLAVVLQAALRDRIPGADGSLAAAGAAVARGAGDRVAEAFGFDFWWAVAAIAAAFLLTLTIPGTTENKADVDADVEGPTTAPSDAEPAGAEPAA